ncbi:MAG TPA: hypothetical protein VFA04_06795 [Bryobacteraceae bacterium]|jgi:hypothetical protein|nr:hypothetical protein [Bryobacteraceae bacterium]
MLPLRLAWILGLLPTHEYETRRRRRRFGDNAVQATDAVLARLESTLVQDRFALVLLLIAVVVLVYTYIHGPLMA